MLGEPAMTRYFVQLGGEYGGCVVFEAVHYSGLHGGIELVERDGGRRCAHQLEGLDERRGWKDTQFDALDLRERMDWHLGVDAARAEMRRPAKHRAPGSLLEDPGQSLPGPAIHRLRRVRVAVEHVAQVEHAELGCDRRPDRRAGDHHVDRPDLD